MEFGDSLLTLQEPPTQPYPDLSWTSPVHILTSFL
jgi:hypothetical protein